VILLAIAYASAGQIVVGSALLYAGMSKLRDLAGAKVAVLEYRAMPAWSHQGLTAVLANGGM